MLGSLSCLMQRREFDPHLGSLGGGGGVVVVFLFFFGGFFPGS